MPISQTEQVFRLVKSLSKSEKRNFTVYSSRLQDTDGILYIKLFELFDKQKELDEKEIQKRMSNISPAQYSNLKRHLYSQILTSLRHLHKEKRANIKIHEFIDFASILYGKGEYMSALKILDKAKKIADKNYTDFSSITIVEFEKLIHSRHITRSSTDSVDLLMTQADDLASTILNRAKLSNLKVQIHKYYITRGHVADKNEQDELEQFLKDHLANIKTKGIGMMEKAYLNQVYVWYYYILNDFKKVFTYANRWIKLFEESQELLKRDVDLYLRGYHYVLTAAFNIRDEKAHKFHLSKFDDFRKQHYKTFNDNSKITSFLYVHSGRMNQHFLSGSFQKGVQDIPRTLRRMKKYELNLDAHKVMIMNYKMAWMYLANSQPSKSQSYLNKIINNSSKSLRNDIQIYSRLMHLMLQYDLDNFESLGYLVSSYKNYIEKTKENNQVHILILDMFKQLFKSPIFDRKEILITSLALLKKLSKTRYNSRAFIYLDVISWLESKISKHSISKIIKDRYL